MYGHGKKNAMLKKAKVDRQFTTAEARIKLKKNSTHQSKLDRALGSNIIKERKFSNGVKRILDPGAPGQGCRMLVEEANRESRYVYG